MRWWPWQSGKSRNREQREDSLKRLTASTNHMLDEASADNQQAVVEAKEAIDRRQRQSAPLRPLLKCLVDRLSVGRSAGKGLG